MTPHQTVRPTSGKYAQLSGTVREVRTNAAGQLQARVAFDGVLNGENVSALLWMPAARLVVLR